MNEAVAEPRSYHIYVSSLMFAPLPRPTMAGKEACIAARLPAAAGPDGFRWDLPSTHTVNDG